MKMLLEGQTSKNTYVKSSQMWTAVLWWAQAPKQTVFFSSHHKLQPPAGPLLRISLLLFSLSKNDDSFSPVECYVWVTVINHRSSGGAEEWLVYNTPNVATTWKPLAFGWRFWNKGHFGLLNLQNGASEIGSFCSQVDEWWIFTFFQLIGYIYQQHFGKAVKRNLVGVQLKMNLLLASSLNKEHLNGISWRHGCYSTTYSIFIRPSPQFRATEDVLIFSIFRWDSQIFQHDCADAEGLQKTKQWTESSVVIKMMIVHRHKHTQPKWMWRSKVRHEIKINSTACSCSLE